MLFPTVLCVAAVAVPAVAAGRHHRSPGHPHRTNVLNKDVVVIGGGASGAYAAVRLRDDYNKSISLVEMRPTLVRSPSTPYPAPNEQQN
jgi:cation diffusion facilitator CzcD-associated flavoprotein CzcO